MDIEKLIQEITEEIYSKINAEGNRGANGSKSGMNIARYIDHTLLKSEATEEQIIKVCQEAREYKFASVCVNPCYVPLVSEQLMGSGVKTCCVIGFPLGATSTAAKVAETIDCIKNGANEVDMVINVGAIKSGNWKFVKNDIEEVCFAARGKALVKVILETCLLTKEEIVKACAVSKMAGADFVKTSTGFSKGGAKVEDIKLMRQTVGPDMGVKASGGIRDYKTALAMIEAGASRVGASSSVAIVKEANGESPVIADSHVCIGCGNCSKNCPSGRVDIVANNY